GRTPVREPRIRTFRADADGSCASPAGLSRARVDVVTLAGAASVASVSRIRHNPASRMTDVRLQIFPRGYKNPAKLVIADQRYGREWIDAAQEEHFRLVDIARTGNHALVDQDVRHWLRITLAKAANRLRFVEPI